MIRLFRINDPFRVLIALGILIAIRLPFLLSGKLILTSEIEWLAAGEAIINGKRLYAEVWTTLSPVSVALYSILVGVFGKSFLALRIVAIVLVAWQAFIFNRMLIKHDVYNEKTYLPAFLYMLFMNISTDFMTLSPPLIALTFLVVGLEYIIKPEERGRNDELLRLGITLGLAFSSSYTALLYVPFTIFAFFVFRSSSIRNLLLIAFGFLFIVFIVSVFFFLFDALRPFMQQYLTAYLINIAPSYMTVTSILLQYTLPLFILLIALIFVFRESGFVNFQVSCQQIMLFWAITAVLTFFVADASMPAKYMYLVPVFSFFVAHQLLIIRRIIAFHYLHIIMGCCFILGISGMYFQKSPYWPIDYQKLWADTNLLETYQGKKLVVLGSDSPAYYFNNTLATPYLQWELASRQHFSQMNRYGTLQDISDAFLSDLPEVIIDKADVIPTVFYHLPNVAERYQNNEPGIYILKSGLE